MYKAFFLILMSHTLFADIPIEKMRYIESALIVKDEKKALECAEKLIAEYPESMEAKLSYTKALCFADKEKEALEFYLKHEPLFKEKKLDHYALEMISWAVLSKAGDSPQLPILMNALQGIGLTNDANAIPMLLKQLRNPSAIVRALAAKVATRFGDGPLKEELKRMVKEERVWYVRLEVIRAIGFLHIQEMLPTLKEILSSPKALAEEKTEATLAILQMTSTISDPELTRLFHSDRSGHRGLACALTAALEAWQYLPSLEASLQDASPDVRRSAIEALAIAGQEIPLSKEQREKPLEQLESISPEIAVSSAWAASAMGVKGALGFLREKVLSGNVEEARLAAAALSSSGATAAPIALELLSKAKDPYVRFNLSWGLIKERVAEKEACKVLLQTLEQTEDTLLMWESSGSFQNLAPSRVRHIEQVHNYPKIIDQLVRLDILSVLCMRKSPQAIPAVRSFLERSDWGIVAEASALLLQEGDETHLTDVRTLLKDKDPKIRLQAALMLALVSSDETVIPVLLEIYPAVPREQKIQILLALGHLGDKRAIPFFLKVLQEPFQQLRVLASSCLIQCLYH